MNPYKSLIQLFLLLTVVSCSNKPGADCPVIGELPLISPDYTNLTIPVNIAPMNFSISSGGEDYFVEITGTEARPLKLHPRNGQVIIPAPKWKKLLSSSQKDTLHFRIYEKKNGKWSRYPEFQQYVSGLPVDKYLYYRMLFPGYESWSEISIVQRSMENFSERTVVNNNAIDQNCVNCHAFNHQNPGDFMIHIRGSSGGTYFLKNGALTRYDLKTKEMENGAVYPRWHPSGKYVAFASNKVIQQFHSLEKKKIEVSDLNSSLVLYDVLKNEMTDIPLGKKKNFMDTYPEWSPDGKTLFFCRADSINENWDYHEVKYNLYRVAFHEESRTFSQPELIFNAASQGKSVSFPRISPEGKNLVFTYHDYGCFPIWHKEADLYSLDLSDLTFHKLDMNSEFADSYHSWSSNGRWMVFSSKRGDGLNARLYVSYMDETGMAHKPFVLPQKDPELYDRLIKSYNVPEFANAGISFTSGELKKAVHQSATKAAWAKAQF